jgi:hypothetical protein
MVGSRQSMGESRKEFLAEHIGFGPPIALARAEVSRNEDHLLS